MVGTCQERILRSTGRQIRHPGGADPNDMVDVVVTYEHITKHFRNIDPCGSLPWTAADFLAQMPYFTLNLLDWPSCWKDDRQEAPGPSEPFDFPDHVPTVRWVPDFVIHYFIHSMKWIFSMATIWNGTRQATSAGSTIGRKSWRISSDCTAILSDSKSGTMQSH